MNGQPEALRLAQALEYCDASVARQAIDELRRLHAENASLTTGYDASRHEIEALRTRVQELGQMARDCNSRRVIELQAKVRELEDMLAAVGAGGVEPLRRCDHFRDATKMVPSDHLRDATEMIGANEAPARKPLTDRQIQDIWCSARNEGNKIGPFWLAHGIT